MNRLEFKRLETLHESMNERYKDWGRQPTSDNYAAYVNVRDAFHKDIDKLWPEVAKRVIAFNYFDEYGDAEIRTVDVGAFQPVAIHALDAETEMLNVLQTEIDPYLDGIMKRQPPSDCICARIRSVGGNGICPIHGVRATR